MYRIPLIKPFIAPDVKQRVCDVLDSGFLTEGPVTGEFEQAIAQMVGVKHCIATTSCTTGLELALRALGVGPGDEVIVPDYTYPATASVVNIVGAECFIVDCNPQTMLIDYNELEAAITPRTKAVIPVSLFGNPLDWERLASIKDRYGIYIVEDAACALGSSYKKRMTGALADITVFSHHPRKFITTGEGGTITTENDSWAEWMVSYKHFGLRADSSRSNCEFARTGTNYKLSNVLAAIGLSQMQVVNELLEERKALANYYMQVFSGMQNVELPLITASGEHSWQTMCIFIENRDRVISLLGKQGIEVQIGSYALHLHKAFQHNSHYRLMGDMAGSRYAYDHALALPLYHGMTKVEQQEVIEAVSWAVE